MKFTRTIAAAAASTALAAALIVGIALPAQAGPIPVPTPIIPGPSVPPLLPGATLRLFTLPSCANVVTASAITATRRFVPSFGPVATPAGTYGGQDVELTSVIRAHTATTCSWGTKGRAMVTITETAITPAEYTALKKWYDSHSTWSGPGGGPTRGGGTMDTHYAVGTIPSGTGPMEVATISPNGWWITVHDTGIGALPYFQMNAVEQFFALNPRLGWVTR
ncbi:MAG: hypothetical protein Q8M65_00345 [Rhodoglobus sp.]|nr:hypothetical protein [Rhodoglobus sp.]